MNDDDTPTTQTTYKEEPKAIRHIDDGSDRSISSKEHLRAQLQADIEAFLSNGGAVENVDSTLKNDPPRKPVSNYGSRPI